MAVENIFEYATRNKVRFSFRGLRIYGTCR